MRASQVGANTGDCIGLGLPQIGVLGTDLMIGNYPLVPQGGDSRRYHLADNVTWQRGRHQFRFGGEWQLDRSDGFLTLFEPAAMALYSPQIVQVYNADPRVPPQARIPLPSSFTTLYDILQLPLLGASIGFGDPRQPPSFRFENARNDHMVRFYWQDRWRVVSRVTLNYGLAYHYQTNFTNQDLPKPDYLAPLLGSGGLGATKRDGNNFAPSVGLVWAATRDRKTVLRAGGGIYYELPLSSTRLLERSTLGPRGTGRVVVDGSLIPNDDAAGFVLHRLAVRFGLPVLPEWAEWFRAEIERRKLVEELIGLNCSPIAVKGTKLRLLRILSQGLRRQSIAISSAAPSVLGPFQAA